MKTWSLRWQNGVVAQKDTHTFSFMEDTMTIDLAEVNRPEENTKIQSGSWGQVKNMAGV